MQNIEYNKRLKEIAGIIGKNVSRARKNGDMTKTELSKKAGISRNTLEGIEKGKRKSNLKTLVKLAEALDIEFHELFKPIEAIPISDEEIEKLLDKAENENIFLVRFLDRLIERRQKKSK